MKKTIIIAASLFATMGIISCGSGGGQTVEDPASSAVSTEPILNQGQSKVVDEVSQANILNIAIGSPDHTTLVAAVQAAQIEDVIVNAGPLTVFAPNNEAFAKLPEGTVDNLLLPENKAALAGVLTMHAAPGKFDEAGLKKEFRKGRKIYMASGDYLTVTVDENDNIFVGGAKVLGYAPASNGIVVVVDAIVDASK